MNTVGRTLFTKIKDRTLIQETSNVVYKIPCKDCNRFYIGQTKQKTKKRNYGHNHGQKHNLTSNGSLARHVRSNGH